MPRGRPRNPPDRPPRRSGPSGPSGRAGAPTAEEAARQQARLSELARDVGEELWRRQEGTGAPASWLELARVLGHRRADTLRRAVLAHDHPRALRVRVATLDLWDRRARAWIAGEDVLTEE